MDIRYEVVKSEKEINGKNVAVYGIVAFDKNRKMVEEVYDICADPFSVASLCRLCNVHSVSPLHIKDVAEDFICLRGEMFK